MIDGFLTWRYWLRRVQKNDLDICEGGTKQQNKPESPATSPSQQQESRQEHSEQGSHVTRHDLPCRVLLEARGLEWFIYNRSPAYDAILTGLSKSDGADDVDLSAHPKKKEAAELREQYNESQGKSSPKTSPEKFSGGQIHDAVGKLWGSTKSGETLSLADAAGIDSTRDSGIKDPLPRWLSLLPLGILCEKGAIALGNENTKCLLITKFDCANGQVGASRSRDCDLYRQTFDFDAEHLIIQLRPNKDYVEPQLSHGARGSSPIPVRENSKAHKTLRPWSRSAWHKFRQGYLYKMPFFSRSSDSVLFDSVRSTKNTKANEASWNRRENQIWHGLSRYLDDEDEVLVEQERWKAVEYAAVQNIVDFPKAAMSLHWDVPGLVTEHDITSRAPLAEHESNINGATPPDWEITFRVGGGTINYGPWADRNREDLQNLFFPSGFMDAVPAASLQVGDTRLSTSLKVRIEFESQAIIRIPTREESKDWKWKGKAGHGSLPAKSKVGRRQSNRAKKILASVAASESRPPGWLEMIVAPDSSITYEADLVASSKGYRSQLHLEFKRPHMSTSVNHDLLWRSQVLGVSCDLSTPLNWSAPRHWRFDVVGDAMEIFLLRDHVFLLIDLANDWTGGPQAAYHTFVPFTYKIQLQLTKYQIFLYANDSNIIDDPSDTVEKNSVLVLCGSLGIIDVSLPFMDFRPTRNKVDFGVNASDICVQMRNPSWNTYHTFLATSEVGSIKHAYIHGCYEFYSATSPSFTDTLILHVDVEGLHFKPHGFLIRLFMNLKDNYFGEDYHFQTLDEYQVKSSTANDPEHVSGEEVRNARFTNDLDVILALKLNNTTLALPCNIYSTQDAIKVEISELELDLRFTNYYMDIEVILSPLSLGCSVTESKDTGFEDSASSTQMFIDGLRIAGHRLFGLPPAEPTYVCNWDLGVGAVSGECSATFIKDLLSALRCIAFSYEDLENSLPLVKPTTIHDLTFLRLKVDTVKVWVPIEQAALLLQIESLDMRFDDWANPRFSDHLRANITGIRLASVDIQSSSWRRSGSNHRTALAYLETSLKIRLVSTKPDSDANCELQQNHIKLHDLRTQRVSWLLQTSRSEQPQPAVKIRAPAMPFPPMPAPIYKGNDQIHAPLGGLHATVPKAKRHKPSLRSKSSFLSDAAKTLSRSPSTSEARPASKSPRPILHKPNSHLLSPNTLRADRPDLLATASRASLSNGIGRPRSAHGQHGQTVSGVLFTSSHQLPHYPLFNIIPDTREVPYIDMQTLDINAGPEVFDQDEELFASRSPAIQHNYSNINLAAGVRLLISPDGLRSFQALLLSLQPDDSESVLDDLQIQAINSTAAKRKGNPSSSSRIRLRISAVAASFIHQLDDGDNVNPRRHRYDINLTRLVSIVGITDIEESNHETTADIGHSGLVHATWNKFHVAAKVESQDDARGLANIGIALDEGRLSLALNPGISGDLSFQNLEVACINRRVTYLSSLLQTTTSHAKELRKALQKIKTDRTQAVEQTVFSLLSCKEPPWDPTFLTSASYVLRSAADHVRLSDSWKMLARLRQIQSSHVTSNNHHCKAIEGAHGAPHVIINKDLMCQKFLEWRGWDLVDPKSSAFIHTIYTPATLRANQPALAMTDNVRLSIEARSIRALVNPGPEQNEVGISNLAVCFISNTSKSSNPQLQSQHAANPKDHTLEVQVESTKARLNWDIFQLIDDMNRQFLTTNGPISKPPVTSSASRSSGYHRCHVMILSGTNTLELASINLQYISTAENYRSSLIIDYMTKRDLLICSDLHVKQVDTNLFGASKLLLSSQLLEPSVHVMLEQVPTPRYNENIVIVAAFCKNLSLSTAQDLHNVFAVIDSVINDEVQHVQSILKSFGKQDAPPKTPSRSGQNSKSLWGFQTVFSLDAYQLSIRLLPSLDYAVRGGLARSILRPKRHRPSELLFDFDLEEHSHGLGRISDGEHQSAFTLLLPPVNGCWSLEDKSSRLNVTAHIVIETIVLDAASLYHAISASLQSDLMMLRESVWRDYEMVKSRFWTVISPSETSKFPVTDFSPDRSSFLFQVHVAITGLDVLASTVKNDAESSHLHFHLAYITLGASNQDLETRRPLEFIEGSINLTEIRLRMEHTVGVTSFPSGDLAFTASFNIGSKVNNDNELVRYFECSVSNLEVDLYTGTASLLVDILAHLRQRLQKLDLSEEIRGLRARQRIRGRLKTLSNLGQRDESPDDDDSLAIGLFTSMFLFEVNHVQISWNIGDQLPAKTAHEREDLVLSVSKIELATKRENAARLMFQDFQVQLVPVSQSKALRSANSALLPKVIFNVAYFSTAKDRRLAFQSTGQSLDLRLTSNFILPASDVQRSVAVASQELRDVITSWNAPQYQNGGQMTNIIGSKRLSSLLVDADFAGAVVYIQSQALADSLNQSANGLRNDLSPQPGRYGQFLPESSGSSMVMRSPGIAWKVEYGNLGTEDPTLSAEVKIDASSNTLHPAVVPLLVEMSSSVREVVGKSSDRKHPKGSDAVPAKSLAEDKLSNADPTAILGSCKLNFGLTICKQEFSLTCQPIARVAATAKFEQISLTINTVQADDTRFFGIFLACNRLHASVQHVYSRESTGTFEVDSIVLSLMNSKHVSNADGISAIARFTPVKVSINAKQVHDFLIFREIWVPAEVRASNPSPGSLDPNEPQIIIVQRYQQMAAVGAFPWNASVSIAELIVDIDFGPILGKSSLSASELWLCSKKSSDWEQSLCLGLDKIDAISVGRMSGSIELTDLRVRTSIRWPSQGQAIGQTPVVEASSHLNELSVKAGFDYQAFLIASVGDFDFLMFNVRGDDHIDNGDRLVGVLNIDRLQAFCTTSSAAQGLALYQAIERLIQEKQTAYMSSLGEIEKHLRRRSSVSPLLARVTARQESKKKEPQSHTPIRLQTDVSVSIRTINIGAFPGTFSDTQLFKVETYDTAAQFTVSMSNGKVHSNLGLQLGLLRIALSSATRPTLPKSLDDVSVAEVVQLATSSRGGTILKVPRVIADMQTWQSPTSNEIDYIFRSSFEGKVEVGWNYSRISFIRGMWANHTRSLAHRLGKPLPQSAVQITGGPQPPGEGGSSKPAQEQEKITAVVNVPLSKYHYTALEPPVIETPQLRDMGEATPPLEWIGLHRERLPNITHQIVIVTLLEVAKEVEDAYTQILGS